MVIVVAMGFGFAATGLEGQEPSVESVESEVPSAEATSALQLLESRDPIQRQWAFMHLEALREGITAQAIRSWVSHRDPLTRAGSLRALAAIEGSQAVPLLLERLNEDQNPVVRRAILLALEPLESQDAQILPAMIMRLRDRYTDVRMTAVDIVSRIDDPRAHDAILLRSQREKRRDVQRVLLLAVKRLQSESATQAP